MYITILNEGKKPDANIKQRILKTNFSTLILGSGQDFCRGIQKQFNSWFRPLRHWAAMELQRRGSQLSTSRPVFGDGSIYLWHTYIHSHTRAHTHTLAQNCHCELCCGMHLTCKTLPLHLTGMGRWRDPRKNYGAIIAIASGVASWFWVAPTLTRFKQRWKN